MKSLHLRSRLALAAVILAQMNDRGFNVVIDAGDTQDRNNVLELKPRIDDSAIEPLVYPKEQKTSINSKRRNHPDRWT